MNVCVCVCVNTRKRETMTREVGLEEAGTYGI